MEKQLLLVMNPYAGQRKANRVLPEILRILWGAGYRCVTYVTAGPGDATEYISAHAGEFDRIVCIGGDGTLNETIAGLLKAGADIPIGYIPAGTTNDYANSLGLSSDLMEAAQDAVRGEPRRLDVGLFNGRYFTYTASCGAFTKASYSTPQSLKNILGHVAYVLEGIKELSTLRPFRLRVETEERALEDDFLFCAITNSTSVGGILKLGDDMVGLDDGKFEVMLIRTPGTPMQLSSILHGITTMEVPNEMVHFFTAQSIRVISETPMEWTLDGERADSGTKTELENLHAAVQIVLPCEDAEEEAHED